MAALLAELGAPAQTICCGDVVPVMPAPESDTPATLDPAAGDPLLAHFRESCSGCHSGGPSPPPFMKGDDARVREAIGKLSKKIVARLDWEAVPPPPAPMPPEETDEYKALAAPQQRAKRLEMIVVAKSLGEPGQ